MAAKTARRARRRARYDFRFHILGRAVKLRARMDEQAFYLINHTWAGGWMDRLMAAASSWAFWWPFLVLGVILLLVFGGFRARAMLVAAGLAVGVTDGIVVGSLKEIVARPRPHQVLAGVRTLDLAKATPRFLALGKPLKVGWSRPDPAARGKSFPSGHTSNNFAIATVVTIFYRRWGWLAFLPAALVSYSRIYVGSHWPSDVLASCFLGAGIAVLLVSALDACWRRWGGRVFPALAARHPSLVKP
jgi:undecaprenyl-diphosphatase